MQLASVPKLLTCSALDRSTRAPSLPSLGALCELFVIRPIVQNLLGKL